MISRNLRHLRVFLAVLDLRSLTLASARVSVSQPAVTQALAKLEAQAGGPLFDRTRQGVFATERGQVLGARVARAFARLDPALAAVSPRLCLTASNSQLSALIAVVDTENFTLAARALGHAQPTVHRAISQLETEAGQELFERRRNGLVASRAARRLAQAARLALAELAQAEAELAEIDGREVGKIVVGALPMARSVLLPQAVAEFRLIRPQQPILVVEGHYNDLLAGLRCGDVDLILGALRDPAPIGDVVQTALFSDKLAMLARPGHALVGAGKLTAQDLVGQNWVVPRQGTPSRAQFDAFFADLPGGGPKSVIEAGSILFMRELLARGDFLGCISEAQAVAEISHGTVQRLDVASTWSNRLIGLTLRADWVPTQAQQIMLDKIVDVAGLLQSQ